ncbi:MAG: hypothetical protein M1821_000733 [Bathelium mastoideum]|nr:MAG: hypothetical protein M1821_000733 [Bathelium mastoideum]
MIVHLSNYLYVFARPDTAKLIKHSVAGSASTSTTISSVLYHSMKHPGVYKRLVAEEIDTYRQAVVKEAMRLEPANSFPLERVVPNDGLIVNGHHLPAGTYVGMTPYIIGRDTSIYGKDSAQFRPERWLDADATTMQRMERHFFAVRTFQHQMTTRFADHINGQFSRGKRGCPGRQLALMLMTKFVVEVLRAFDIEWAGDNDSWDFRVWWITQKNGFLVKFIPLKEGQN